MTRRREFSSLVSPAVQKPQFGILPDVSYLDRASPACGRWLGQQQALVLSNTTLNKLGVHLSASLAAELNKKKMSYSISLSTPLP